MFKISMSALMVVFLASSSAFADARKAAGQKVEKVAPGEKIEKSAASAGQKAVDEAKAAAAAARMNAAPTPPPSRTNFGTGSTQPRSTQPGTTSKGAAVIGTGKAPMVEEGSDVPMGGSHSTKPKTTQEILDAARASGGGRKVDDPAVAAAKEKANQDAKARAEELDKMDTVDTFSKLALSLKGEQAVQVENLRRHYASSVSKMSEKEVKAFDAAIALYLKNANSPEALKALEEELPKMAAAIAAAKKQSPEQGEAVVKYFIGAMALYGNTPGKAPLIGLAMKKYELRTKDPNAFHGFSEYLGAAANGTAKYATAAGANYDSAKARVEMRGAMKDWGRKRLIDNKVADSEKVEEEICDCTEGCPVGK